MKWQARRVYWVHPQVYDKQRKLLHAPGENIMGELNTRWFSTSNNLRSMWQVINNPNVRMCRCVVCFVRVKRTFKIEFFFSCCAYLSLYFCQNSSNDLCTYFKRNWLCYNYIYVINKIIKFRIDRLEFIHKFDNWI